MKPPKINGFKKIVQLAVLRRGVCVCVKGGVGGLMF